MKLHENTPECVVFFLAGSLPGSALLHLRQLSLFGMISRLPQNILRSIAVDMLVEAKTTCFSWFQQIRNICVQYQLPHPLTILENPPSKGVYKKLCKLKVVEFWRKEFQYKAGKLDSLKYFKPAFHSLTSPHPIFTSLNGNPYESQKAKIQSRFISGRYRTERLCRFWSSNKAGICLLESCRNLRISEDLEHIIFSCKSLRDTRSRLENFTNSYVADKPILKPIIETYICENKELFCQFIIDCSVLPLVISSYQMYGPTIHEHLYYITRTWCHSLHRDRLRQLGRWNTF